MSTVALFIHLIASFSFLGLIWYVQIIAYPQFKMVDPEDWIAYERNHTKRSFWLIAPLFCLESIGILGVGIYLWSAFPALIIASALCYFMAYTATFTIHVPLHRKLSERFNKEEIDRLIKTNWWRTAAWTAKAILAMALLYKVL
jgi:hypothetical protein